MAIHTVQKGDSLWAIAKLYNTSIQSIMEINGLESSTNIVPGLALYIPDEQLHIRLYKIKAGDTLWSIAIRYNTTAYNIISANPQIDPNRLSIGQIITIPSPNKAKIQTLGFLVPQSLKALEVINKTANSLTYIAIVAYSFLQEGWAYRVLDDAPYIQRAKQLGIKPLLMIRNITSEGFSAELAGAVLANATLRRRLIDSIVNLTNQAGYAGVSIDFEFIPPPQRYDFVTFLKDLKQALESKILHVNVHAKTEDVPTNRIIGAYDYLEIGNVADIVAVMTMDYGYPTGPPNPIAPLWWMEQVVQYSVGLIDPRKMQIALPLYGYDWKVPENITTALSANAAQNFAISVGAEINYDILAASPYFGYQSIDQHVVWFVDIRGYTQRYQLVDLYKLLGVTFWQLQFDFPQNWAFLKQEITVIK
ncbi:LysM peptidoglycan-binding domain-containing protein [Schinkia azotoformans]|uniref:Glycosyl hydrolase n=2 Tax=Schinkia azotoformans TaxID=1454 RepID=K6CD69_SCHAZ|nr:LysM peptidoglycan-binding domain-containing protein [Schinkia azotoformans]EKN69055.1 glycosyl hydrolase [Schinkia azotoformans LMG 9581]MEC1638352.1 LysM peptidoglycan-binding domain-containing protein [Schinkia azotoformans]MEC1721211.1 LysM peptidoglycan-binding domain-containing protein [Schinkia azotoformans]MEC1946214.1 LysM peptidoglycan-binding domain-containing protein [Schinkia azotoformans]MED4414358.1 LysM peptidoglycan-binding domain-containing protein [Schinkia azotoformans]